MTRYPGCFAHMVGKSVARKRQLLKFIPGVMKCKSMLYIGANPRRFELMDLFWAEAPQMKVDVLEAWEPNIEGLEKLNAKHGIFRDLFHGDIKLACENIESPILINAPYDIVMFWHGPEHIDISELPVVLNTIEFLASKYVILGCPWGKFPQKDVGGNPYEEHKCSLYPDNFKALGYKTSTIKKPDKRGGHILAWKKLT